MDNKLAEIFFNGLSIINIKLDAAQILKFDVYINELLIWNKKINLIGPASAEKIIVNHFIDSLSVAGVVKSVHSGRSDARLIDVGTGAGFPGLPLKIYMKEIQLTLVDSTAKKAEFLRHLCRKMDIKAEVLNERAENVAKMSTYAAGFDIALARAVAKPPSLKKLCFPLLKNGGFLVLQVSSKTASGMEDKDIIMKTGLPENILPGRSIIVIRKPDLTD